jgi:type I restriction enzyme M protein
VPPRKRAAAGQVELFGATSTKDIQDIMWQAADKLRGSMDASQYKEFVLGLVFLKYVSDAFVDRRAAIRADLQAEGESEENIRQTLEDEDEYTGYNVFWVPAEARWDFLAERAAGGQIGELLDAAMLAIMNGNARLKGVLPMIFNRDNVDQTRLAGLVNLMNDARFTGHADKSAQDVLGEVYEYFLAKFAAAEGKRAGEFYTPASVVRLLVEVLEPYEGRVYDPCCGSGGMFVQAGKFIEAHRGKTHKADLSVYGQEFTERTWRLAKMNLAIHGIEGNLGPRWADTFADDKHPDLRADYIMANPPFNMSDWARKSEDKRWKYGTPPQGNANYAWLQHILYKLGDQGSAGVVLANGSMSSKQSGEGEIRQSMVEADLVACMVAMPSQLFRSTQIPACLWFLTKDKTSRGGKLADRAGQVLFIDARNMGTMVDRTERVLTAEDLAQIAGTYHAWRGTASAKAEGTKYEDVAGFCYSASLKDIRTHDYVLTPGRYVGAAEVDDSDDEPIGEKIERLTMELFGHFEKSAELEKVVREQLGRIDV